MAREGSVISSVSNLHKGDTALDNAALASILHEMLLFDDGDVEDVSSQFLSNSSADSHSCFGIVDSITLTRCKRVEFLLEDDDGEDFSDECAQSKDGKEDEDLIGFTQLKATAVRTRSRSGIRRDKQDETMVAIKTKTTDG